MLPAHASRPSDSATVPLPPGRTSSVALEACVCLCAAPGLSSGSMMELGKNKKSSRDCYDKNNAFNSPNNHRDRGYAAHPRRLPCPL